MFFFQFFEFIQFFHNIYVYIVKKLNKKSNHIKIQLYNMDIYMYDILSICGWIFMLFLLVLQTIYDFKEQYHNDKLSKKEIFMKFDEEHNTNDNNEICKMFNVLGYYHLNNTNKNTSTEIFHNIYINKIYSFTKKKYSDLELKRSIELSKFLIYKTTTEFYNALTDSEIDKIFKYKNLDSCATYNRVFYF